MRSVAELFKRLEKRQLSYAVLRNYENFPDLRGSGRTRNTDIDLVVRRAELPVLREVLISVAADCGWDVLTECGHFSQSRVRHHNIEVFRFYRNSPLQYLQVDVFHALLVWGLPFMDEEDLLRGRKHDSVRGLTHMDPLKEQTFRLIQIHGLGQSPRTAIKRERYRRKIEAFREHHDQEYLNTLKRYFGSHGPRAAAALRTGDAAAFKRMIQLGKRHFWMKYWVRHPLSALFQVSERQRESRLRFNTAPCGCTLDVHAGTVQARASLQKAMELLIELNVVDEWIETQEHRPLNAHEQNVLEQGGLLVQWTDANRASVVVEEGESPAEIATRVAKFCAARHASLYTHPTAVASHEFPLSLVQQ